MQALAVGQQYEAGVYDWPQGCIYNYSVGGHWLFYFYRNPTPVEVTSIMRGSAHFGLFVKEPVIFLLHKFGDMPWSDAPYSWGLVPEDSRCLPELDPNLRALLKVAMIDAETGVIAALRALTFSSEFTWHLHNAIRAQSEREWDAGLHERTTKSIYSTLTPEKMIQRVGIRCKGGE